MLSRVNRLNKQKDFDGVFGCGKNKQDGFLVLRYIPNSFKYSRFGIVVSAKVAKRAVDRNRLRRQMSEILRLNQKNIKPGFDVVLVAKTKSLGVEYGRLKESLTGLLRSGNLYV
ncbi:MAG: ribonuclease P protein component [Candidatus Portnoybacteria bacterium]|nr:ribonuclease P protein component [Candidatus Portnoybacteria bacterium]MDD4982713.1 ribonuclease P protein component [Candidatus Portnoybacteria bacterium]